MVVIKPGNLGNPFSRVWSGKVTPRFEKPSFPKIFFIRLLVMGVAVVTSCVCGLPYKATNLCFTCGFCGNVVECIHDALTTFITGLL